MKTLEIPSLFDEAPFAEPKRVTTCCYLDCIAPAQFRVIPRTISRYGFADACAEHVGRLLIDAPGQPVITDEWRVGELEAA